MTAHVSPLVLDALDLDALPVAEAAVVRAHLESCARCRAMNETAAVERANFRREVFPQTEPAIRARGGRIGSPRHWWPWLGGALAFACIALLWIVRPRAQVERQPPSHEAPELGVKGTVAWQVIAHRRDRTFQVRDGESLAAGDQIRFVVTADRRRYLLIASIDGNGTVSIYFPYGGTRSGSIEPTRAALDDSIMLDDAPGPERLFALFSDEPLDAGLTSAVREQLRAVAARGADAIRAATRLDVASATQLTLVFEKAAP